MPQDRKYLYGNAYYYDGQFFYYAQTDERVPGAESMVDEQDGTLQMKADELLVHNMMDMTKLASYLGIERESIPPMVSREQIVAPQIIIGKSPLWSRKVVLFWKEQRPGKGANFRNPGTPTMAPPVDIPTDYDTGDIVVNAGTEAGPMGVKINPQPQPAEPKGNVEIDDALIEADIAREEAAEKAEREKAEQEAKQAEIDAKKAAKAGQ